MSSIVEKSKIEVKRSFFLRTGSFEKFKCSAKYPFRLAGIKLSKDAIIELVAELIVKARILSQKAFLMLFIVTFKFVSALLSVTVVASAKPIQPDCACDNHKNKSIPVAGYYERLQQKLIKLQKHKNRLDSLKSTDESFSSALQNSTPIKCQISNSQTTTPQIEPPLLQIQPIDKKLTEFKAEISKIRNLSSGGCKLITTISSSSLLTKLIAHKDLKRICLFPIVYGSIIIMYSQLYFLAIALNSTCVPPGLIFLIASLTFVAFITFKVFFIEKFRKVDTKAVSRQKTLKKQSAELRQSVEASLEAHQSEIDLNKRQSRTRVKDLVSQQLNKTKLL